ncbi:MAG: hypothetical protein AABZ30_02325 [Myxococcota bacterium]
MTHPWLVIGACLAIVGLYLVVPAALTGWVFRRKGVGVMCPETAQPVRLRVSARSAALAEFVGDAALDVLDCSRWPERRDCDRRCVRAAA